MTLERINNLTINQISIGIIAYLDIVFLADQVYWNDSAEKCCEFEKGNMLIWCMVNSNKLSN